MINRNLKEGVSDELSKNVLAIVFEKSRLTPNEVAEVLGVDKSFISLVRNGKRSFRIEHLLKLEEATGLPIPTLLAHARPMDEVHADLRPAYRDLRRVLEMADEVFQPPPSRSKTAIKR